VTNHKHVLGRDSVRVTLREIEMLSKALEKPRDPSRAFENVAEVTRPSYFKSAQILRFDRHDMTRRSSRDPFQWSDMYVPGVATPCPFPTSAPASPKPPESSRASRFSSLYVLATRRCVFGLFSILGSSIGGHDPQRITYLYLRRGLPNQTRLRIC